jgi:sulfatase maturation enzyme AslB (radical SAM superfamily)
MDDKNAVRAITDRLRVKCLSDLEVFPKFVSIETINRCNAACVMCYVNKWSSLRNPVIDDDLFLKITEEIKCYANWIERVELFGRGEPTLDPKLPERVEILKKAGLRRLLISTNATLLSPDLARTLIKNGLDNFDVSLDSMDRATYEKIRLGLNYDIVLSNIHSLIEIRNTLNPEVVIRIRVVIQECNEKEFSSMAKYWSRYLSKQDSFYGKRIFSVNDGERKISDEDIAYYADKPCVSPFSTIYIRFDGRVGLCDADYKSELIEANIKTSTIKEIWNCAYWNNVRSLHVSNKRNELPLCRGCSIWNRTKVVS